MGNADKGQVPGVDAPVRLTLLTAGWTTHRAGIARRGAGWSHIRFPALVALIEHPEGVVLFDTGYAPRVVSAMSRGIDRLYGGLLPVHISTDQTAVAQLAARGIAADQVDWVVLSHLHADHIGGLRDFPAARIVADPRGVAEMRRVRGLGRLRRGLLPALLPDDLPARLAAPERFPLADADTAPLVGRDLLGDGSLLLVSLPGHSPGDLGLLVRSEREVLLIGDAAWDLHAVSAGELPHPVARLVTDDWPGYRNSLAGLRELSARRPELRLVPSHDEGAIAEVGAELGE